MANSAKTAELIGQVLADKYHLETVIGEGGFGAVFSARNKNDGKHFAIKILYADDEKTSEQRVKDLKYFQREVGTLARVRHPGIVTIYEGGMTAKGRLYLVME